MKEFLNPAQRISLRSRHRSEKDRRTADRIKAVLLADLGWSCKQIAEALFLDEGTVLRHVNEYVEQQKLSIKSGGSQSKMSGTHTAELIKHLEDVTYVKIADICVHVLATYGISYTIAGMRSWLKFHKFSYKKPKGTPSKADPVKQEAFIKAYEKLLKETPENEPVLFGDGVHPTMATKITYGWIRRGQDKPIATTASRTRMNLFGSINLETMTAVVREYETINSEAMVNYFKALRATYPDAPLIHLIIDNGPYNTSDETRDSAKELCIKLHFLPPYSPNLNPTERLWKVMNENVRNNRVFKSTKEFGQAIMGFFKDTWPKICWSMTDRINDNFQRLNPAV